MACKKGKKDVDEKEGSKNDVSDKKCVNENSEENATLCLCKSCLEANKNTLWEDGRGQVWLRAWVPDSCSENGSETEVEEKHKEKEGLSAAKEAEMMTKMKMRQLTKILVPRTTTREHDELVRP